MGLWMGLEGWKIWVSLQEDGGFERGQEILKPTCWPCGGLNVLGEKGLEQLRGKGSLHGVEVLQGHYQRLEGSIVTRDHCKVKGHCWVLEALQHTVGPCGRLRVIEGDWIVPLDGTVRDCRSLWEAGGHYRVKGLPGSLEALQEGLMQNIFHPLSPSYFRHAISMDPAGKGSFFLPPSMSHDLGEEVWSLTSQQISILVASLLLLCIKGGMNL